MDSPLSLSRRVRMIFDADDRSLYTVPKFCDAHKKMLVIIADPQTDRIFVSYKGKFVNGRIRSARGKATHVVRDMLKAGQFRFNIDGFISSLVETLNIPLKTGNQFYQFLDGAIFNIAKSLKKGKTGPAPAERPPAAAIKSPIRAGADGRPEGDI